MKVVQKLADDQCGLCLSGYSCDHTEADALLTRLKGES